MRTIVGLALVHCYDVSSCFSGPVGILRLWLIPLSDSFEMMLLRLCNPIIILYFRQGLTGLIRVATLRNSIEIPLNFK